MKDDSTVLFNNSVELIKVSNDEIIINLADIISSDIAIFRLNKDNKLVTIPIDKIEQYLGESLSKETSFFIEKDWKNHIKKFYEVKKKSSSTKTTHTGKPGTMEYIKKFGDTNEFIRNFHMMSIEEREEILDRSIENLHELKSKKTVIDLTSILRMVEVIANTFYANYINLDDNLSSSNLKNNIQGIFVKTEWAIKILIDIFTNNGVDFENYAYIDKIQTGSYTIDNMNKGLLWFIGFAIFYNNYIDQGLVTKKIRGEFKDKYSRYYRKRLGDDMTSIERVIRGGLKKIDTEKQLPVYSEGALLYDIGKVPFISYHDSSDEYDENMVKIHVLLGYNMILKTRKYPFTVTAMAAFHHEYYGGKGSYNFTNPIISKLTQKKRTEDNVRYFITYDEKEFREGLALSFFPCKIIEIIDIYNALVHHKKNSHFDAMKIMKKNFITSSLKIDPIIFEIFLEFKHQCGQISAKERKEIDAIIY